MSKIEQLIEKTIKTESWFKDMVVALLLSYKDRGAVRQDDYIKMAVKDRETDVVDYLLDIDDREWRKIERMYLRESISEGMDYRRAIRMDKDVYVDIDDGTGEVWESVQEATQGFKNNMLYKRGESFTCPTCGLHMPKYEGRYPSTCPSCKSIFEKPEKNKKSDEIEYLGSKVSSSAESIIVLGNLNECCYLQIGNGKFAYKWEDRTPEDISERIREYINNEDIDIISFILNDLTFIEDGLERAFNYIPEDIEGKVVRRRILEAEDTDATKQMETWWNGSEGKKIKKEQAERFKDLKEEEIEEIAMHILQVPLLETNQLVLLDKLVGNYADQENIVGSLLFDETADEEKITQLIDKLSFEFPHTRMEKTKDKQYFIIIY